jgi:hypothetical protein
MLKTGCSLRFIFLGREVQALGKGDNSLWIVEEIKPDIQ